ncbi:hypothetical protein SRHO_G00117310 [Serrasalmus rhombeus]
MCWWKVLLLSAVLRRSIGSILDCPPTCSCSSTEIFCNKSYQGTFFPLLTLHETGSEGNGTHSSIPDLFENITSMYSDMPLSGCEASKDSIPQNPDPPTCSNPYHLLFCTHD